MVWSCTPDRRGAAGVRAADFGRGAKLAVPVDAPGVDVRATGQRHREVLAGGDRGGVAERRDVICPAPGWRGLLAARATYQADRTGCAPRPHLVRAVERHAEVPPRSDVDDRDRLLRDERYLAGRRESWPCCRRPARRSRCCPSPHRARAVEREEVTVVADDLGDGLARKVGISPASPPRDRYRARP